MADKNKLTVEDILKAQEVGLQNKDPKKTCETCKHIDKLSSREPPCNDCFDSFLGIYARYPSKWEDSDANH